jgi:hypothetical protein
MRDIHTIRLRGPWQLEPLMRYVDEGGQLRPTTDDLPPPARATMPADWSAIFGSDFQGQVRHTRHFHAPAGLEDREQVWLAITPCHSCITITLNNTRIDKARFSGPSPSSNSQPQPQPQPYSQPHSQPFRQEITHLLQDSNLLEITVTHPPLDATGRPTDDRHQQYPGGLTGEVRLEIGFP